jgi:hypothetical protein
VAVAVWIVPSLLVASAIITALPLPIAVTVPALDPGDPAVLVFTGKLFGKVEIHVSVGELVRSLTVGVLENVPIARNCPVSCRLPTVIELGMMVSESRGSGAVVATTVMLAVLETTLPSLLVNSAVIVLVPVLTPVASPVALTVAIEGALELHLIWAELVTSDCSPLLPEVPSAINWLVWVSVSDCVPGVIATAVYFYAVPPVTVKVAVPATTVPPVVLL